MQEEEVIRWIGEAVGLAPGQLKPESRDSDFLEWDSMGLLAVVAMLDRHGIHLEPGDSEAARSVAGVLKAFRDAGKLT